MPDASNTDNMNPADPGDGEDAPDKGAADAISIVQRGNLKTLETTLSRQWRMGQNIVLCWSADERGVLVILVPHYFLGNYCATDDASTASDNDNEVFVRDLISGKRCKTRDDLFAVSKRLDIAPTFIKLDTPLTEDPPVLEAVEQIIRRYGLSYVQSRAVFLIDIVDFSLHTPFEQASQLNSLSYSLNSAYNKLKGQGVDIKFARTSTGDGYYIWNRDLGPGANQDLFLFMLLFIADNAVAQEASKGKTVPVIRTAYHIGGHYELYLVEGVNPSVFSYIVGDVTIELARMLDMAKANQVLIGEFHCDQAGPGADTVQSITAVSATTFITNCDRHLHKLFGIALSGKSINGMSCRLTEGVEKDGQLRPRRFRITDKHELSHFVYNLEVEVDLEDHRLELGLPSEQLPGRPGEASEAAKCGDEYTAPSAEELIDDLANLLSKKVVRTIVED